MRFLFYTKCFLSIFVYLLVFVNKDRNIILSDLIAWNNTLPSIPHKYTIVKFTRFFALYKEFRSLVLFRLGLNTQAFLKLLIPTQNSLEFISKRSEIGPGLIFYHGYSTIIFAEKIGKNCKIYHNVTIGRAHPNGRRPRIGDNVEICTGSVIVGDIEIGNNVIIGANSVVIHDLPSDCLAAGNPAKIIKIKGQRV